MVVTIGENDLAKIIRTGQSNNPNPTPIMAGGHNSTEPTQIQQGVQQIDGATNTVERVMRVVEKGINMFEQIIHKRGPGGTHSPTNAIDVASGQAITISSIDAFGNPINGIPQAALPPPQQPQYQAPPPQPQQQAPEINYEDLIPKDMINAQDIAKVFYNDILTFLTMQNMSNPNLSVNDVLKWLESNEILIINQVSTNITAKFKLKQKAEGEVIPPPEKTKRNHRGVRKIKR